MRHTSGTDTQMTVNNSNSYFFHWDKSIYSDRGGRIVYAQNGHWSEIKTSFLVLPLIPGESLLRNMINPSLLSGVNLVCFINQLSRKHFMGKELFPERKRRVFGAEYWLQMIQARNSWLAHAPTYLLWSLYQALRTRFFYSHYHAAFLVSDAVIKTDCRNILSHYQETLTSISIYLGATFAGPRQKLWH